MSADLDAETADEDQGLADPGGTYEGRIRELEDALESAALSLDIGAIPMRTEELFNGMRAAAARARAVLGRPSVPPTQPRREPK